MGDTPGKKARKAAQAAQAAREQQENVGAASAEAEEPAGEPAAGMDPAQQQPVADPPADPNRALEAGLAALSGTVRDLQARVDQVESGCATQHDLSNTLHAVREQGNELDKLATKVNSAQNTMKGHARELGGLQSGVADVQARTVKPDQLREVAEAVAKAQDTCMKPFIKQVISQELTSTMGALQTFMIDNLLKQQPQPAPAPGPSEPAAPAAYTADSSNEESDKEGKKVSSGTAKSFKITKPAAFSGEEDVDEALFTLETYFESTGCDRMLWPKMVMTLLAGKARSAYMATATTHTSDALTWDMVRKCLLDAFAAPDKRIKARTELHQVKQGQLSAKDYVRHVRAFVTKCGPEPPCAVDLLMFFFNGLNRSLQEKTAIDPHTGRFWTDFDALANHLITMEMHSKDLNAGFRPYRKPKPAPPRVN